MKSRFDPLLKAIKQRLNACELAIAKINQEITQKEEKISELLSLISEIHIPSSGNALFFKELYEGKKAYLEMIDAHQFAIATLKGERRRKQEEHRAQCLEIEKIQYLISIEMKEKIKLLKTIEQRELDEIATMRFGRNKDDEERG